MTEIQNHEGSHPPPQAAVEAGKFLTCKLNREEYGLKITKVQEIIGVLPTVIIPGAPDKVRGMVNLRGTKNRPPPYLNGEGSGRKSNR